MTWNPLALGVAFCVMFVAMDAQSQEVTTASRTQRALLQEGLDAHSAGDFATAVARFKEANAEGELNITWLNLGRALQKAGDCQGASEAFEKALTAPAVPRPDAAVVAEAAGGFRDELNKTCPGTLYIVCVQPDLEVVVDGTSAECGVRMEMSPGVHQIVVRRNSESKVVDAEVRAFETVTMTLGFAGSVVISEGTPPEEAESSGLETAAWVSVGAAGAFTLASVIVAAQRSGTVDDAEETENRGVYDRLRDDYDSQSTLLVATAGLAVVSGAVAGYLLFLDSQEEPGGVGILVGPGQIGIQVRY
jgi:tetratricopeptide (TPR) repeat protein